MEKCVDLNKFMRESNVTPDFGFDSEIYNG